MNNSKKLAAPFFVLLMLIPLFYLFFVACEYGFYGEWRDIPVVEVTEFTLEMNGETSEITLPIVLKDGTAGESVVLTTTLTDKGEDRIYFKSVFAPLQVYVNDTLLYDYGGEGTMPSYLEDPATNCATMELPDADIIELRLEYTYPTTRSDLILDVPMVGSYPAIFNGLLNNEDAHLFAFFVFLSLGLFLFLLGLIIRLVEPKGSFFVWLGLISLCCGLWGLGECDLSGIMVHNESILYLITFTSVFYLPIFVHCFFRSTVGYRNKRPITLCIHLCLVVTCTFSILQATSLVSFYNALPFFTCFTIVTALFSIGYTIREWRVHDNQLAKIFLVPWCLLIVATIIEGIHFFLGYIDAYGQFVHLAVIFFIIINTIIGAMILRKAFALREQNRRMEQEYKLMEVQVSNQQRYNHLLLETRQLLRQQRHDLRHQLAVIQSHAQVGALDQLNHHLESVVNQIPEELESYCENLAVNAVVAYYTGKSKAMGIAVTIQLSVPESLERINDSSLCVIFGNILENAVEACQRMNGGTPFITLTSYIRNDMLVITQKNSYQDPPRTDGTSFLSSKDQTTGIGLSSVKSTAHKHNGNAIFIAENGVFHSSAYVRI